MRKFLTLAATMMALAACADDTPPPVKLTAFDTSLPVKLDVLMVNVVDHSTPPDSNSPYTTNNFQPTIAAAIRDWATHHFTAAGSTGQALIVIDDASLNDEKLPYSNDLFERKQASKYVAHATAHIQVSGREGSGSVTAEASRFQTLPEKPSLIERTNAYNTVLNGLMRDLTAKLDTGTEAHLTAFTITAPILNSNY